MSEKNLSLTFWQGAPAINWYKISYHLAIIIILLTPVLLNIVWQAVNTHIPTSETGSYYRDAYLLYQALHNNFVSGIHWALHADLNPSLFIIFTTPFVFIGHGNIPWAIAATLVTLQLGMLMAYYWLFSYRLPSLAAALLAATIATIPFVFSIHTQLLPETIWHMWFILCLAALLRSAHLTKTGMTLLAGTFLSFTILAKPIDSMILTLPLLAVYLFYLYREKILANGMKLINSLLIALIPILLSALISFSEQNYPLLMTILVVFMAVILLTFRAKFPLDIVKPEILFIPMTFFLSLWYFYYANKLALWIGEPENSSNNIIMIFTDLIFEYGFLATMIFLGAALASISIIKPGNVRLLDSISAAIFCTLVPMLCIYAITGTKDGRHIFLGMVFLIITFGFTMFRATDKRHLWINYGIVASLLCIQTGVISAVNKGYYTDHNNLAAMIVGNYKLPRH